MKKLLITMITIFSLLMLSACIEVTGATASDNSINYGEGTVLECTDANCTVSSDQSEGAEGDAIIGVYDADYTQAECTAAGFFYCTIENVCMDTPVATGICGS